MALTKVTGHVVLPTTNIEFHNTKSTGIVTFTHTSNATSSTTGALQITGGVGIVKDLFVGGNITVGGTITYDDVTNIDSLGIITARNNIHLQDYIYHRGEDPLNSYFGFPASDTIDFFTAGERRLRIESSGRIGINTDSAKVNGVHVYDKHLAVTQGYPLTWLQPNSTTSRGRFLCDSGTNFLFQFGSGNEEKIRFNSDGEVGIGTNNPQSLLHLHSSNPVIRLQDSDTSGSYSAIGGESGFLYLYTNSSSRDIIFRGSTEVARLTGDGYLGINSITPSNQVDIFGNSGVYKILGLYRDFTGSGGAGISLNFGRKKTDGSRFDAVTVSAVSDHTGNTGEIRISTLTSGAMTEKVRINSSGQVGIGTAPITGDQQNLTVHGDSNYIAGIRFRQAGVNQYRIMCEGGTGHVYHDTYADGGDFIVRTNSAAGADEKFRITEEGKVGIGTDNPSQLLHLAADSAHKIILKRGGASPSEVTFGNEGNYAIISNNTNGIELRTGSTPSIAMHIDQNGRVGIGTDNPSQILHILDANPIIQFTDTNGLGSRINAESGNLYLDTHNNNRDIVFRGGNSSANEVARITGDGKVGIGTNNPSSAWLDIATTVGTYDHLRLRRISSDSNIASNWSLKPYGNSLYFRHGGSTDRVVIDETAGIRLMGSNQGNHMSTFGSNVGGLRIDDVGHSHTALEVSHGTNKVYVVASSNNNAYFSSYATGNILFEHTGDDASRGGGREALRINTYGQITTRGATGASFNNVGSNDFGSFLVVNGGHTTNEFGILSLEGNANGHGQGAGHIQFINQANGNGSSGGNVQSRLIARIDAYTETSDTNANDDSGGTLRFFTKEEGEAPGERLTIKGNGRIGINDTNPDRDLQVQNQAGVASGGTIRLVNRSTSMNNGQIAGLIEFEQRDSNTPGVSATIRSEMQDTTNGNCMLAFQTGTPSTIGTRLIMHGAGTITVPQGPTQFPDGTTASALVNTSGRQPNSGNDFQTGGSGNKSIGWYTIAVSNGGRAWGRIGIRDTASSRHQAVTLFCGHHYGGDPNQNSIHAISSGRHSGNPLGAVRIRGYGTYDGAMLQVYLRDSTNGCQAFLLGDNIQTHGWIMKNWIADGTDPGDLVNWSAINSNGYTSAYSDLNVLQYGGTSTDGHIIPGRDNVTHLGNPSYRFDDIYATNTTIQSTSDERLKQDIAALTTAEMNAAKRMSALFKTFRWKDRVLEKGDKARTHTGVIAQQVKAALEAEGLDFTKYGFIGFNEWYEDSEGTKLPIDTPTRQGDSQDPTIENNIEGLGGSIVVPDGFEKKSLYSIRIGELLAFIAAYNEQRFTSIESRLTALESS